MSNKFTKEKPLAGSGFKPFQKFGFLTKLSSDKIINFNPLPPVGQKSIRILFSLSLFLTLVTAAIITILRIQLPSEVPLFYSRPWGEEQLVKRETLYLVPILSLLVLSTGYPTSLLLLKKGDKFLSSACASFPFLFSLLGIVSVIRIIPLTM